MAKGVATVVRAIRQAVRADDVPTSDRELLRRFAEAGDQDAFAALVRRHGAMVLGVCRRALPTAQDAEDACQATFLILARKARGQRWQTSVANWLYTTARRVAANARLAAQRRARREGRATLSNAAERLDHVSGRELLSALDEELDRLPACYREPLVLCYLEGLTRDEAASRLGVPPATLKSQLERGRKKLADALTERGCALAALAISSPTGAFPPRLVEAVLASASGPAPAAVAALAEGVIVKSLINRSLWTIVVATAVAWLGAGAWFARPTAADEAAPAKVASKPEAETEGRTLTGRVVDPDGKPAAKAVISLAYFADEKPMTRELATTDADGRFRCVVPAQAKGRSEYRTLVARADGFGADWVSVRETDPARPVALRLAKTTVPVRGRVLTLEGKPVAKAVVHVRRVAAPDGKNGLKQVYERWAASPNEAASLLQKLLHHPVAGGLPEKLTTDADGRFILRGVGDDRIVSLEVSAGAIETLIFRVAVDAKFDPAAVRFDPKKADPWSPYTTGGPPIYGPTFDHAARPCRIITGTVVDQTTRTPLADVAITARATGGWWELGVYAKTDAAGRFRVVGLPNAECELSFGSSKPSPYLMLTKTVGRTTGLEPATVVMPMVKGTVITGRVTDKVTGKPIKGGIGYFTLAGNKHLLGLPGQDIHDKGAMSYRLDEDGRFRFVAPAGLGIIVVQADSWHGDEKQYPQARRRAEDKDKPYLGTSPGLGEYFITTSGVQVPMSGHHAYRVIEPAAAAESLTADLQLDPGKEVAGNVVGPDGKPFAGATMVGLGTLGPATSLKGDAFTVRAILPDDVRTIAAAHAGKKLAGTAVVRGDEQTRPVVKLASWGAVTGRLVNQDGEPVAGARVLLHFADRAASALQHHLTEGKSVTTDKDGRFRCDVPFGGVKFDLHFTSKGKYLGSDKPLRELTVKAGETSALGDIDVKTAE